MIELPQNQRELNAPGRGLGSLFTDNHEPSGLVTVAVGPYVERLPVGNGTVGEIRSRFRQRFDIDPRSQAVLDGNEVNDDTVVRTGQVLMFVHKSGEKGGSTLDSIEIEGREVRAVSPEGKTAAMPLSEFFGKLMIRRPDAAGMIFPDGVKSVRSEGNITILAHETPPQVYNLKWIANDSPAPFGHGATYRNVRVALPYLITLLLFRGAGGGQGLNLGEFSECFFRTAPLETSEDELLYPALLNCSKFTPPEGRPLSWICVQHLNLAAVNKEPSPARRMRAGFRALRHCLLETGFNYSSENHEGASWFSESRKVDPRVNTIDAWQEATAKDPLFVLEVPWLKTGHSLGQIMDRIFKNLGALNGAQSAVTSAALARLVFNHKPATAKKT
jgi:hypothetical protein